MKNFKEIKKVEYVINKKKYFVDYSGSTPAFYGENIILSNEKTDITYNQSWYEKGYEVFDIFNKKEFINLKFHIKKLIQNNIKKYNINTDYFNLEKYHKFANTDEIHHSIISYTRDLFPKDLSFCTAKIIKKLENVLGMHLCDVDPDTKKQLHTIVRINRPYSNDFNPPHKDIYESLDRFKILPKLVNFWIPICGTSNKSTLPLAPKSHLLNENTILRIVEKTIMNKNTYRVRGIINWNESNLLTRPSINDGQVLVFSPHLIHGCAFNEQKNKTRVALELRLFKK